MTSPLEREILTHYWVSPEPWPKLNEHNREIIERFVRCGFLRHIEENAYGSTIEAVREALEPYMNALSHVPLPIRTWIIPEKVHD